MSETKENKVKVKKMHTQFPQQLSVPIVPRAFMQNYYIRYVLCDIISDFSFEEQQAIYYCCVTDFPTIEAVAKLVELSQTRVISVLNLYSERLYAKLQFFKKIATYDENDLISVSEMLFHGSIKSTVSLKRKQKQ